MKQPLDTTGLPITTSEQSSRKEATSNAYQVVTQGDFSVAYHFHHLTPYQGISAIYMAMDETNNPKVKSSLAKLLVDMYIDEGGRQDIAFSVLARVNATELDLPYTETDVYQWFTQATESDDLYTAWNLAQGVITHGDTALKHNSNIPAYNKEAWQQRETETFYKFTKNILTYIDEGNSDAYRHLETLFDELRTRPDGYTSEHPSALSLKVANYMIDYLLDHPVRRWTAPIYAKEARMPQKQRAEIRLKATKVWSWLKKIKRYIGV